MRRCRHKDCFLVDRDHDRSRYKGTNDRAIGCAYFVLPFEGAPISHRSKWGTVMLAKCSNLFCCARFRFLRGDKLLRLESDPVVCTDQPNQTKCFFLCHRCSSTMSLRLLEDGTVVATLLPEPVGRDRDDV